MKHILLIVLTLLIVVCISNTSFSQGQPPAFTDSTFEGTVIIDLPGISKDEIYSRTKFWLSKSFVSSKYVTDLDDKSSDVYRIMVKPLMLIHVIYIKNLNEYNVNVNYNLIFSIKDGRVKMQLMDFYCNGMDGKYSDGPLRVVSRHKKSNYSVTEKMWPGVRNDCKQEAINLMQDFYESIPKKANPEDDF
jgi:hypothetical protein